LSLVSVMTVFTTPMLLMVGGMAIIGARELSGDRVRRAESPGSSVERMKYARIPQTLQSCQRLAQIPTRSNVQ
jgi:hypothetical protein